MILMVIVMGILFAYVRYRFMPLLLVGIGLVTSLGLMGFASFPITSNFGITPLIAVGFSLMGAIFIMHAVPSLRGNLSERLEERKKNSG